MTRKSQYGSAKVTMMINKKKLHLGSFYTDRRAYEQLEMYGFIVNNHNTVAIANRIFEMRLCRGYGEIQNRRI